jgi:TonB-dependent starch-binding outer membrane protein SusC
MKKQILTSPLFIQIMRVTLLQALLIVGGISLGYAHSTNAQELLDRSISVNVENVEMRKVLAKIETIANVKFVFSSNNIQANRRVSLAISDQKLSVVLNQMLKPLGISYTVMGDQILLNVDKNEPQPTLPKNDEAGSTAPADQTVTGIVTDENEVALPGVNILVKGTKQGTSTNTAGEFSLSVPNSKAVLVFSYIGYESQEVTVGNRARLAMTLKVDTKALNEVVVVGYGTQKKRDITGAVSSVTAQQLRAVPVMSADQALQGRVSGVQVQQTNGAPGGAVQVRIRGVNSTAGGGANQPLYVIDGVPLTWNEGTNSLGVGNEGSSGGAVSNNSSPLASLNPNDIESMEILKDASATAIYGARAANGVVLITTKSGKVGKTTINFDAYYGVQSLRKKIPMLNARERMSYIYEHRRNAGTRGNEVFDIWAINPYVMPDGVDWQDELFRQAAMQNYSLSAQGGTEKVQFSVSADYFNQQGIVLNTDSKRYSTRINLDIKASEKLKFGTRTALSLQNNNGLDGDEFFQGQLNALNQSPLFSIYDANGQFNGRPNTIINENLFVSGGGNQVANLLQRQRKTERFRINSNIFGEYSITKELKFRSLFGVDYLFNELRSFNPLWQRGIDANTTQTLSIGYPKTYNWLADQTLSYDKSFGNHTISALAGFSAQQFLQRTFGAVGQGSTGILLDQMGNNPTPTSAFGGETPSALVSQYVRVNYSFKDKYLFTGTARRDGSSRFGSNNSYGIFPSFSLGWRLSEERFLKNVKAISDAKLRMSYGSTGNQNIGDFLYLPQMFGANNVFGNTITPGVAPGRFENQDIKWERNNQFDVGLDLSLFQGKINITADYYDKLTVGLLAGAPLSVTSGVGNSYITNIGKIRNKGFEFAINAVPVRSKDFRWEVDFNIATNQNRVESIGELPFLNGASIARVSGFINRTQVGQPIGGFFVVLEQGQYQTWEEARTAPTVRIGAQPYFTPGDFIPIDQNGDKIIDDNDRVWYGSPFPDFFGGFGSTWTYKGLSFNVVGAFQYGNLVWNQPRLQGSVFEANVWRDVYENRWKPWQPAETTVAIPRNNNPLLPSNRFLDDGSFMRIRTMTLSYQLPNKLINKAKLSRARIYAQANNLLTFTKYPGWDPEVNSFGSNVTTNGIDIGGYPIAKSLIFGVNLSF